MTETRENTHTREYTAAEVGALAHLYRGEMYRSTVWRTRLDTTTNWAVVTTGIALSVTFSSVQATPLPIVLISFLLGAFLLFEARRCQYFDIWNTRVRVMESCFYDPLLRSKRISTDNGWNDVLADDLSGLRLHLSLLDATGLRLRRNYGWIFAIQIVSYWSKIGVHPTPLTSFGELWDRTAVGPVPGPVVLLIGALFYLGLLVVGVVTYHPRTRVKRDPDAQVLSDRLRTLGGTEQY
jgi:uncharacterized membrane protein